LITDCTVGLTDSLSSKCEQHLSHHVAALVEHVKTRRKAQIWVPSFPLASSGGTPGFTHSVYRGTVQCTGEALQHDAAYLSGRSPLRCDACREFMVLRLKATSRLSAPLKKTFTMSDLPPVYADGKIFPFATSFAALGSRTRR
jgi:hypothetical protein